MKIIARMQPLAVVAGLAACQANGATSSKDALDIHPHESSRAEYVSAQPQAMSRAMPKGIAYDSTTQVRASMRPASLCELAKHFNAGTGIYRVDSIQGVTEDAASGKPDGFSYVQLTRTEDIDGAAPERVVARISGGPARAGVTKIWDVELTVGETIGALLLPATQNNRNYLGLHTLGVFREKDGGFTNGQIFTTRKADLGTLRSALQGAAGREGCVADVFPDMPGTSNAPPVPADVHVHGGRIELQQGDLPAATSGPTVKPPSEAERPSNQSRSGR